MPAALAPAEATAFDYAQLRPEARAVALDAVTRIRLHGRRSAAGIVGIGRELLRVKAALPRGAWYPWLATEFGWTDDTALNFMRAAEFADENPKISGYDIDVSALYLLAAPSTPASVRQAAIDRGRAGGRISHRFVKDQRDQARKTRIEVDDEDDEDDDEPIDLHEELIGSLLLFRVVQHDPGDVALALRPAARPRCLEQAQYVLAWLQALVVNLQTEQAA